jgi:mono/diheme cytochrome c family protein
VAYNLTPDPATGIGTRYNEASFIATMRTGKKPNGTAIMPPMPSDVYKNMTDDDLKAIFAYLRTIPPIRNAVYAGITPAAAPK